MRMIVTHARCVVPGVLARHGAHTVCADAVSVVSCVLSRMFYVAQSYSESGKR